MTATIFLSSLVAERNILLIRAVFAGEEKLLWCWLSDDEKKKSPLLQRCKLRPRDASDDSQNILDQHSCHSLLEVIRMRYRVTIRLLAEFYIRCHARLQKFCFDCVVRVDDNSVLRCSNDTRRATVYWPPPPPPLTSRALPRLSPPLSQHLVYFVFLSLTRVHLTASHLNSRIRDKDLDPTCPRKKINK